MSAILKNDMGKIIFADSYLTAIVGTSASECYGIVGMSDRNVGTSILNAFKNDSGVSKGVRVITDETENVKIELYVTVRYGVTLSTVAENIIDKVKYSVEKETGLNVEHVNIVVQGIEV